MVLLQRLIETALPRLPQPPVATLTGHDIFDLTKNTQHDAANNTGNQTTAKPADQQSAIVTVNESSDAKRRKILDAVESRLPVFRQRLPKNASSTTVQGADEIMDRFEAMTLEERTSLLKRFSSNRYLISKVPRQKFNLCKFVCYILFLGTNYMPSQHLTITASYNSSSSSRLAPTINIHAFSTCKLSTGTNIIFILTTGQIKMSKGHIMPAYCLIFDKTGDRMFTVRLSQHYI